LFRNTGFLLKDDLLFIPVPGWEGWELIQPEKRESMDHMARWEFYFHPKEQRGWIFLRITWPSVSQIVLGFVYPDDRKLLEMIASHRRLALIDHSLIGNLHHPLARVFIINDIPVELLKVFDIGFCYEKTLIQ
jgi:hypothetical protein